MKKNLSNHECVAAMAKRIDFENRGRSIFGKHIQRYDDTFSHLITSSYTVFSYGMHFPMYVYDFEHDCWYGNSDKYSRTTSKHQSLMRPPRVEQWVDTGTLIRISSLGMVETVGRRIAT